ncbi:MAG: hypothetical protein HYZ01_09990 [Ignavibacteriales bacterium]|nr:hypothetical protein [Ignavibacteriales bacterium]
MKTLLSCLIVVFLVVPSMLLGQQQQGDLELGFQGFYFTDTEGLIGVGTLQGKIGSFFTDNLEIGFSPSLSIVTTTGFDGESETTSTFGAGAFLTYSFLSENATTVPYFGAQYYKSDFDDEEDSGSAGINAGVKFYFTKKAAFDVSGNYLFSLNENAEGGLILISFGLSFLF